MDQNKVRFGFKNVYYALLKETDGVVTYDEPKKWRGAVSLTLDPEGETATFNADDTAYFTSTSNNGYTGTLEMAYLTDDVLKDIFNYIETEDGSLAEDASLMPNPIALLCEFSGDIKATRHTFYKMVFSRPGTNANTKGEQIEPDTMSMNVSVVPVDDGKGHNWTKSKTGSDSNNYDAYFTKAPTLPTPKQTETKVMAAKKG